MGMNNLYGWAISEYHPDGRFQWLKNVDGFDVNSVSEKSPIFKGIFLKLILKILMSYMYYTMIID